MLFMIYVDPFIITAPVNPACPAAVMTLDFNGCISISIGFKTLAPLVSIVQEIYRNAFHPNSPD